MTTEQEIRAAKDALVELENKILKPLAHIRPVLAALEAAEQRIREAQAKVDESHAALEIDRALIASRVPDMEKARALTGTIADLERQVAALEARRDFIQRELDGIGEAVRRAVGVTNIGRASET